MGNFSAHVFLSISHNPPDKSEVTGFETQPAAESSLYSFHDP